ncbi:unnamed protein product [Rotaria magnacalcarata]|uniref:LamG domain-containing protein n=1 Tax=Rotaria magnacalcarata TaxID=392030 RepID=A0A816T255_9BILA|nr:unnamed protein product [Rotaria magnacalcarata]
MPTKKMYRTKVETVPPRKRPRNKRHRNSKTNVRVGIITNHELALQNHDFIVSSQEELNSKSFAVEDAETIPSDQIQLIVLKSIRPSKSVATSVYTNEADFDDIAKFQSISATSKSSFSIAIGDNFAKPASQVLQAQQLRAPQLALLPRLPQQVQQPLQSDNAIFGQHDQYGTDLSLQIIVRSQRIYFGFYGDDTQSTQTVYANTWYHMAYICDYSTLTQYVYVNGVLDGKNSVRGPATEILSDATQIVAYIFDNTLLDSGPLGINGSGVNYSYTYSGRVCLGLSLSTTVSYAQVQGLVLLGTSGEAYSMTIWSNPIINTVGTIIHVSPTVTGGSWSMPMLGFTNTGRIGVHGCSTGGSILLTEPIVASNV